MEIKELIQEIPTDTGFLKTNKIVGIENISLKEGIFLSGQFRNVIALQLSKQRPTYYLTYFPTEQHRINCWTYLLERHNIYKVTLEKYFFNEVMTNEEAEGILRRHKLTYLNAFVRNAYKKIFNEDFAMFAASDAFKMFTTAQQAALLDNRNVLIPNVDKTALVWAKTIRIPETVRNISPLQFYRILIKINNEKFKINTNI